MMQSVMSYTRANDISQSKLIMWMKTMNAFGVCSSHKAIVWPQKTLNICNICKNFDYLSVISCVLI